MKELGSWRWSDEFESSHPRGINEVTFPLALLERLERISNQLDELLKVKNEEGPRT